MPKDQAAYLVRPHSDVPSESARYGLGFWLHPTSDAVILGLVTRGTVRCR